LKEVTVWKGVIGAQEEECVGRWTMSDSYLAIESLDDSDNRPHYLRAEVVCSEGQRDRDTHRCMTNPVWVLYA
jgi:hypothetical protein